MFRSRSLLALMLQAMHPHCLDKNTALPIQGNHLFDRQATCPPPSPQSPEPEASSPSTQATTSSGSSPSASFRSSSCSKPSTPPSVSPARKRRVRHPARTGGPGRWVGRAGEFAECFAQADLGLLPLLQVGRPEHRPVLAEDLADQGGRCFVGRQQHTQRMEPQAGSSSFRVDPADGFILAPQRGDVGIVEQVQHLQQRRLAREEATLRREPVKQPRRSWLNSSKTLNR